MLTVATDIGITGIKSVDVTNLNLMCDPTENFFSSGVAAQSGLRPPHS